MLDVRVPVGDSDGSEGKIEEQGERKGKWGAGGEVEGGRGGATEGGRVAASQLQPSPHPKALLPL